MTEKDFKNFSQLAKNFLALAFGLLPMIILTNYIGYTRYFEGFTFLALIDLFMALLIGVPTYLLAIFKGVEG